MLLTRDEPEHTLTLRELTLHAIDEGFGIGWSLLSGLLRERGGTSPLSPPPANIAGQLAGMSGVLQALVLYWREDAPDPDQLRKRLETFAGQLESRGYRLLACEIRTLLHLQFSAPPPGQVADRFPLSGLWRRKAAWEYALEALSQLTPKSNDSTSRLAWLLKLERYGAELTPLEQIYDNGRYQLDTESALPLLAGHPAVFWHDAPDIRIDIEPGQVTLNLTEEGDQLTLTLTLSPAIRNDQNLVTRKETPTRLVVYPVSDEHRRIADIVGRGLRIPVAAREKALQSVSATAAGPR